MILQKRIPKDFYRLFRTRNMEAYMMFLVAIYDENNELYTAMGLTTAEGAAIIGETMERGHIYWQEDEETADEETTEEETNETDIAYPGTPTAILRRLIRWGWLKSDYDERLNTDILSFPEYSQLYVSLFKRLQKEDDSGERESILSIYSALYTYHADREKNNEILKSALRTSKNLEQLLSNMQNGMRAYFDELSQSRNFMEIQKVLVDEINNSDSKRYAILTTSDSFYRYKEAVKELISQILNENEELQRKLVVEIASMTADVSQANSLEVRRNRYRLTSAEEAMTMVYQVEREFDLIERRYNKLIEQKAVFAKRALARIRYIFQEGIHDEDNIRKLLQLLSANPDREDILAELGERVKVSMPYKALTDDSLYRRRDSARPEFRPLEPEEKSGQEKQEIADFVPKPLYTRRQLRRFYEENSKDGVFTTTEQTVTSMEDLEKMMFLWQEATGNQSEEDLVHLDGEFKNEDGFAFSKLTIQEAKAQKG